MQDIVSLTYAAIINPAAPGSGYGLAAGIFPSVSAAYVDPVACAQQAAAVRQYFSGKGLLPALAAAPNQIMFIGCAPAQTQTAGACCPPSPGLFPLMPAAARPCRLRPVPSLPAAAARIS